MARRLPGLLLLLVLGWVGCARAAEGPLVFAASSLQESLSAAASAWSAQGHAPPVISFAASSALARQIEAGARADVFLSADEAWMDYLEQRGLVRAGTRVALLPNRLVLIAPIASTLQAQRGPGIDLAAGLGALRLALADPESVPAGRYARASKPVRAVDTFPTGTPAPIVYPIALLRDGANPDARAFYDFLVSPAGRAGFADFGFIVMP